MKKGFIVYTEIWPVIQKLDMEQRGQLFTAIMKHAMGEEPEKLDILVDVVFTFIASQIDRADEKYQDVCRRRAEYGRRGGLASAASKSKQKQANQADKERDKEPNPKPDNKPNPNPERDKDKEVRDADGLSLGEREELDQELGHDRVTELIEEVNLWAINNGKTIRDLPAMVRQFAKNQKRWGGGRKPGAPELNLDEIFKGLE
jgi:hypothetical protein